MPDPIELEQPNAAVDDQIARAAAQMLARIGIQPKVETHPAANYFNKAPFAANYIASI